MFVVVSHHHCKPGQTDVARERVDKNGAQMSSEPGFLYRYRIENPAKPGVVSTMTVWNAEADYKGFRDRRAARGEPPAQAMPWDRIEGESYEVHTVHGTAPK
jgi:heme-degrading monooxygenase HmoA